MAEALHIEVELDQKEVDDLVEALQGVINDRDMNTALYSVGVLLALVITEFRDKGAPEFSIEDVAEGVLVAVGEVVVRTLADGSIVKAGGGTH